MTDLILHTSPSVFKGLGLVGGRLLPKQEEKKLNWDQDFDQA